MTKNCCINTSSALQQFSYAMTSNLIEFDTVSIDDNIPTQTFGTEILTVTITPKCTSNIVVVRFNTFVCKTLGVICAIYQDTGNALSTNFTDVTNNNVAKPCICEYNGIVNTTSPTTFKVRVGGRGITGIINGTTGTTRLYGGVSNCLLTVMEYVSQ